MSTVRSTLVVLATVLALAAPRPSLAQQTDPYVSCVRCHALPLQQALATLGAHGYGSPALPPEMACGNCHDTWFHEQDPSAPPLPFQPYFWRLPMGSIGSTMTKLCLSGGCHMTYDPDASKNHPADVIPFLNFQPSAWPPTPPTSVLPLFDYNGSPNQIPSIGGLVCSTCHDPHTPSYSVNSSPKFLRIGTIENTLPLCTTCHIEYPPGTLGTDLFIASSFDSVRFQRLAGGMLKIDVKVKNRGNVPWTAKIQPVTWDPGTGYRTWIGSLSFPLNTIISPEGEATGSLSWMPPPGWAEDGFFFFELPPSTLRQSVPNEYVRAMNILPTPTNVRIDYTGPDGLSLAWDPPLPGAGPLTYDVHRDGVKVNLWPIPEPAYVDYGLAPETPHVYTVTAVQGDLISAQSDPVGATTTAGYVVRVPQDYPTIQEAIDAALPGTSIHVAAGTYSEQLSFWNKNGITVKGQDANGCILETPMPFGPPIILRSSGDFSGNTLSGFTIKNQPVDMGAGDVLAYSVLQGQASTFVGDGGLVAHCVFDTPGPTVFIGPGQFFTAVNSIFRSANPLQKIDASSSGLLLNNNFPYWTGWSAYQGSGNFGGIPLFEPPGPPDRYFTEISSITTGKGLELENWVYGPPVGPMPDVGAFSGNQPYTPRPPSNLNASWLNSPLRVRLTWTLSPDDARRTMDYWIYRSEVPFFPPGSETTPYQWAPRGIPFFEDTNVQPGVIYYYQVRAYGGPTGPYAEPLLSAPTNIAQTDDVNFPPVAMNDFPSLLEDQSIIIPVLMNDTDPDGDPLTVSAVTLPLHGAAFVNPDNMTVTYLPAHDFFGTDTFTYTVSDGRGGYATAQVSVAIVPVNDPPVAMNDGTYTTFEDTALVVAAPGVLANDTDVDSALLSAALFTGPAHGALTLNSAGSFTYTPAENYNGLDSFTYRANDGTVDSDPATVTITVDPVNDAPVAVNDGTYSTLEDTQLTVTASGVLGNDTDIDSPTLSAVLVAGPAHGTLTLGATGSFSYTPAENYFGPDSFTYRASDGQATSDVATVSITVTAVNDAPLANAGPDKSVKVNVNTTFDGSGSADVDGTIVSYTWNFGDKTTATGMAVTKKYKKTGTYTVTLTVKDNQGATGTDTVRVTVTR